MMNKYIKVLKYLIATGIGAGYTPIAPGTAGSLLALVLFWFLPLSNINRVSIIIIFLFAGIWAGNAVEKDYGKDPGLVVIDEITGQWIALLWLPHTLLIYIISFLLFRVLDIVKPFPANRSQTLQGGIGIMADDIFAGIYTNLIIQIYFYVF